MEWRGKRTDDCAGMEAVEGVIVLTTMTLLFVFFLSFGFLFYQQSVVLSTANDTATRIAQSYAYSGADPVMGFVSKAMRVGLSPYRYWNKNLENGRAEMGENYAKWYLDLSSMAILHGSPSIQVKTVHDGLAQRHVEVEIIANYELPLGGILTFIGVDKVVEYRAVGRAVCIDLSDYLYSVNTVKALPNRVLSNSKFVGTFDSVLGFAQHVRNFIKEKLANRDVNGGNMGGR